MNCKTVIKLLKKTGIRLFFRFIERDILPVHTEKATTIIGANAECCLYISVDKKSLLFKKVQIDREKTKILRWIFILDRKEGLIYNQFCAMTVISL